MGTEITRHTIAELTQLPMVVVDDRLRALAEDGRIKRLVRGVYAVVNRARLANADMMRRVERIPGLKAVYEGKAAPDDFVQQYVISRSAKALQTADLAAELRRSDPQALEAVRGSIAAHLKTAAIGAAADETGKFSASGYNRALMALGSRKLSQFFDKDEIAQIRAVGRVAQYTTAQPVGSAVNNSNSATSLMGRGLDLLDRLSSKVPLLGGGLPFRA